MIPSSDTLIALGLIKKPQGLSGELAFLPYQQNSSSFRQGLPVVIKIRDITLETKIEYARQMAQKYVIKLEDINSREIAEDFKGGEVFCRFDLLAPKKNDEYYVFDLIGLKVIDNSDECFGKVKEVLNLTANDILVIESDHGELIVPMVKQFVDSISIDNGFIKISKIRDFIL